MPPPSAQKAPGTQAKSFNPESTQFFSIAMLELSKDVPAWVKNTQEQLRNQQWAAAQKSAEAGLAQNPIQVEGILFLAEAHWEQVHARQAVDFLKQAIQVAPRDSRPYALLGRYLLLKGLREQAVSFLSRAVALNPDDTHSKKQLERTRNLINRGYQKVDAAPGALAASGVKKEASKITMAPPVEAPEPPAAAPATEAPPPEVDLDRALAALLSADLFPVDPQEPVAESTTPSARRVRFASRALVALLCIGVGVPVGFLVRKQVAASRAGAPLERAYGLLKEDSPGAYVQAAELLDKMALGSPEYEAGQPLAAMAAAVRAADLGGGVDEVEAAERALANAGAEGQTKSAALYARHLLARFYERKDDSLDEDIKHALADKPNDAGLHVVAGRRAEDAGDETKALEAYRRAYRLDATLPLAAHALARAHARIGDHAEARSLVDALLNLRPFHDGAIVLGLLLTHGDKPARASYVARATAALENKLTRPDAAAHIAMAMALVATAQGDDAAAAPMWERAQSISESQPALLWTVSRMLISIGEPEKARTLLMRGIAARPSDVRLHLDLTRVEALLARGPEHLRGLRTGAKEKRGWPELRLVLGTVFVRPGHAAPWEVVLDGPPFPEPELAAALSVDGLSPAGKIMRIKKVSVVARAQAALASGEGPAAKEMLEAALADNKRDEDLLMALARTELVAGERDAAEKRLREVLEMSPQEPRALLLLASILVDAGNAQQALKTLQLLERADFESGRAHALKARALTQRGQAAEARRELQKAKEIDAQDPEVAFGLADAALHDGRFADALSSYTTLAKSSPARLKAIGQSDAKLAPLVGKALFDAGAIDEGLAMMRQAVRDLPDEPAGPFYLGAALVVQKNRAAAQEALERFLALAPTEDGRRAEAEALLRGLGVDTPPTLGRPAGAKRRKNR